MKIRYTLSTLAALATLVVGSAQAQAPVAVPDLAAHAAAAQAERLRYPEFSRPVLDGVDPIRAQRVPSVVTQRGPGGQAPALSVWNDRIALLPGETLTLHARLDWLDTERPEWSVLSAAAQAWQIRARVETESGQLLGTVEYNDAGQGVDRLAGDRIHTASLSLPVSAQPQDGQARALIVKVTATASDGTVRQAAGGLLQSNPAARLTGDFRPVVRDGDLIVQARALVTAPGRVHLSGTLGSLAGTPLVTAQAAQVLEPGLHWLDLRFSGVALADVAAPELLRLSTVTLRSTNGMPNALGPVLQDVATVPAGVLAARMP